MWKRHKAAPLLGLSFWRVPQNTIVSPSKHNTSYQNTIVSPGARPQKHNGCPVDARAWPAWRLSPQKQWGVGFSVTPGASAPDRRQDGAKGGWKVVVRLSQGQAKARLEGRPGFRGSEKPQGLVVRCPLHGRAAHNDSQDLRNPTLTSSASAFRSASRTLAARSVVMPAPRLMVSSLTGNGSRWLA